MTFSPIIKRPRDIPKEPIKKEMKSYCPSYFMRIIRGLMAFATSFDPWERQTRNALKTIKYL